MSGKSFRGYSIEKLEMDGGTTSQWLNASPYRSCFCACGPSDVADWTIEAQLPDGNVIQVGSYNSHIPDGAELPSSTLFYPNSGRYVNMNVMCGLPIRFVSSAPQTHPLFVTFKT